MMDFKKMNDDGFVNLMEAIIEQARKDADSDDVVVSDDAKSYLETMEKAFS